MKSKHPDEPFKLISYILLLPFSFLVAAVIWSLKIAENLYVCNDPLPILNFIPPFVHGSQYGDYYLTSAEHVYSVWVMFIAYVFIGPLYVLAFIGRNKSLLKKAVIISIAIPILYFIYAFSQSTSLPPAAPTPVNISQGEYRIVKLGENYAVSYNNDQAIEYIGTTTVDLSSYLNQRVLIEGEYKGLPPGGNSAQCETTKQQCIKGECHQVFKNNADICNLVIQSVSIKE